MSTSIKKELYDDIVLDYAAAKTNIFKVKFEEPEVRKLIGDVSGQTILDLACGAGNFSREFKEKGAKEVVGVDISEEMIKQARLIENESPLGITYHVKDAVNYISDKPFDIITAFYLFCYADSKETLLTICQNAYKSLRPGGRFIAVTTVLDEKSKFEDISLGYKFKPCHKEEDEKFLEDVLKVDIELYSKDMKSKCCFPNFLWKPKIFEELLNSSGFNSVDIQSIHSGVPVMSITAIRNK